MAETFYSFCIKDKNGKPFPFNQLKGKVILIVNIGFSDSDVLAPQMKELDDLYLNYKDKGLIVLGFPCDQFTNLKKTQKEVTNDSMMCTSKMVSFPIVEKVDVNGTNASPVWQYLKKEHPDSGGFTGIKWNFAKFLVSRKGIIIGRYSSLVKPFELSANIEHLLSLT